MNTRASPRGIDQKSTSVYLMAMTKKSTEQKPAKSTNPLMPSR